MQAKSIIQALRHGTPPHSEVFWETIGREREISAFDAALKSISGGDSMVKLMLGDFGVGKSELMSHLKQRALEQDFVISSFQIQDGFRFNKIDDLYYAIMHNLSVKHNPDDKTSFNDLFDIWLNNLQTSPFPDRNRMEINTVCQALSQYNMNFARAFLSFMRSRIQRNPEMQNITTAWLTGERNIPFELKQKYGLTGFVDKTNTVDFLRAFTKLLTLLDYKGLIVFVDELDLILNYRSDLRMNAFQNLKQLIDISDLNHAMFYFSGTKALVEDSEKGIASLPSLAQRLNFTTPDALSHNFMQPITCLEPLNVDAMVKLGHKIYTLYRDAYPERIPIPEQMLTSKIFEIANDSSVTRTFITQFIAYLDS